MQQVRLISHGPSYGKFNMAVDEAVLNACIRGEVPPTLRFYSWKPKCFSLGYFQDAAKEVNPTLLSQPGVSVVRRLTGGKAVLHDDELTYSVVIPETLLPGTVLETYNAISRALVRALNLLGVGCRAEALEHGVTARDSRFKHPACFAAPSWYEIVSGGKKVVGSAQCRRQGVILQHGSIPFHLNPHDVAKCAESDPERVSRMAEFLEKRAWGICEAAGREISRAEVENALIQGFREEFPWQLESGDLTPGEVLEATTLSSSRYGTRAWTETRGKHQQ